MLKWRKSQDCTSATNCIEVLDAPNAVYLRNSKYPEDMIWMEKEEWARFKKDLAEGKYD